MLQKSLFAQTEQKPLAAVLRPSNLKDLVGVIDFSEHNLKNLQSLILWGPPGSGKTTLARIIANNCGMQNISLSAVTSCTSDFKKVFDMAACHMKIVILVDEIQHLNKSQQDIFLPHIESASIILIGTTTENPSFELRPALLSRCKVIVFKRLTADDLMQILARAEQILDRKLPITNEAKQMLCEMADGDARYLINRLEEIIAANPQRDLTIKELCEIVHKKCKAYDKNADEHYNLMSALHKSMRGSDPDAALYWFARMVQGGEDIMYIARRVVRAATEDVGMADSNALNVAISAMHTYNFLGSPEGELAIAEAIVYVAVAPKSNAVYTAYNEAMEFVKQTGSVMPPKCILNPATKFMHELGYGEGYVYDHDMPDACSGQNYFPSSIKRQRFYRPTERGAEKHIKEEMSKLDCKRNKHPISL